MDTIVSTTVTLEIKGSLSVIGLKKSFNATTVTLEIKGSLSHLELDL